MKNLFSKLLALVIGILVLLFILEAGLTLFGISETKKTKALSANKTTQSDFTVLCLGDSNTVGLGAPAGQSYPDHLENILRAQTGKNCKVVNAGILAANTYQILENLEANLEKFSPNVVVVVAGGANFWNFFGCYSYQSPNSLKARLTNLAYRIKTFRLAKLLWKNIKEKHHSPQPKKTEQPLAPSIEDRLAQLPTPMNGIKLPVSKSTLEPHKQLIIHSCNITPQDWNNSATMNDTGEEQSKIGNSQLAIICFERALELKHWDSRALFWLGSIYSSQDNQPLALSYLLKGFLANPTEPPIANKMGLAFFRLKNYEKALRWALHAIKLAPYEKDYYYYLSPCLIKLNFPQWALKKIQTLIDKNPQTEKYFASINPDTNVADFAKNWIKADIRKMRKLCREKNTELIIQTYLVDTRASAVLRQLAAQDSIPLADSEQVFLNIEPKGIEKHEYLAPDRHPNSKGYKVMAQTVADTLKKYKLIFSKTNTGK